MLDEDDWPSIAKRIDPRSTKNALHALRRASFRAARFCSWCGTALAAEEHTTDSEAPPPGGERAERLGVGIKE